MTGATSPSIGKRAAWLCVVAVWLQVLLPVVLHSTGPALTPSLIVLASDDDGDDDGCALEHAGDAGQDNDSQPDSGHHHDGCLACQAMHFMPGSLGAVSTPPLPVPLVLAFVPPTQPDTPSIARVLCHSGQARAPPVTSI